MNRTPGYRQGSSLLFVMLVSIGIVLYFALFTWLLIFLIVFSGHMPKWLYFLLLFLYFGMLMVTGGMLYRRIELRRERALYGDEAFFAAHPKEWKRELRRWKRSGAYRSASDGPAVLDGNVTGSKKPYDELYYETEPNALQRDLRRQRFFRRVCEKITRSSKEPSAYEKRLEELRQKLGIECD